MSSSKYSHEKRRVFSYWCNVCASLSNKTISIVRRLEVTAGTRPAGKGSEGWENMNRVEMRNRKVKDKSPYKRYRMVPTSKMQI